MASVMRRGSPPERFEEVSPPAFWTARSQASIRSGMLSTNPRMVERGGG